MQPGDGVVVVGRAHIWRRSSWASSPMIGSVESSSQADRMPRNHSDRPFLTPPRRAIGALSRHEVGPREFLGSRRSPSGGRDVGTPGPRQRKR